MSKRIFIVGFWITINQPEKEIVQKLQLSDIISIWMSIIVTFYVMKVIIDEILA